MADIKNIFLQHSIIPRRIRKLISIYLILFLVINPVYQQVMAVDIDLSELGKFKGEAVGDDAGISVSSAGDINNDGYDDFLIGADGNDPGGAAYLIYGAMTTFSGNITLSTSNAKFIGEAAADGAGISVSSAGDVNNDGYVDFLIGAEGNSAGGFSAGAAYLIYGSTTTFSGTITLNSVNAAKFIGEAINDFAGHSVSSAGDVNNDGYDDFLIGAYGNDPGGAAYLIYGATTTFSGNITLSTSNAKFRGEAAGDSAGRSVSSAGDVNNDGYDDFLVGAYGNNAGGNDAGAAYLIYGSTTTFSGNITLSTSNAKFRGEAADDGAGGSVSSAGDVNNDGYDDFMIGAGYNNNAGGIDAGAAYLIYGSTTTFSGNITLSTSNAKFIGEAAADSAGISVSRAGDVNNDGYNDFLIGAYGNNAGGEDAGAAYLIYGSTTTFSGNITLSTSNAKFIGEAAGNTAGIFVSSAGDVNNDGYDDLLVGANFYYGSVKGAAYLGYLFLDADGDGVVEEPLVDSDEEDNCPSIANADQIDTDNDDAGDACDSDDDNDSVADGSDAFPLDSAESVDTDSDSIGNNADTDDDNDGVSDSIENNLGTNSLDNTVIPEKIHSVYFSIDKDESIVTIVNNTNTTKSITYVIYNAIGTIVTTVNSSVNPKSSLNINLLDSSIVNSMAGQTEGSAEIYYTSSSLDIIANTIMTDNDETRTSPFLHTEDISSDTLSGVWFIKTEGSGKVYLTNTSKNNVTLQLNFTDKDGISLSSSSIPMSANSTQSIDIPFDQKLGIVTAIISSGNPGDLIGQIVTTDEKTGNTDHILIDASLQQSNEEAKGKNNMGNKACSIFMKPEVNGIETKGYVVLGNLTSEARLAYTSIWTKEGDTISLSEKSIPANGVIKQKIYGLTEDKILGIQVYHEGSGFSVVGNVYVSSNNAPKIGNSYLLKDKSPSDLTNESKGYNRDFDTTNDTKSRLVVQNLSSSTRNVTADIYDENGNLAGTKTIAVNKKKAKSVNIGNTINDQTVLGHVEMSHDGIAGDVKGNVVVTNTSLGTEYVSPILDQESQS